MPDVFSMGSESQSGAAAAGTRSATEVLCSPAAAPGKQTAKSAVQLFCAVDHSGLVRTGFSKLGMLAGVTFDVTQAGMLHEQRNLLQCSSWNAPMSREICRRGCLQSVPVGRTWSQHLNQEPAASTVAAFSFPLFGALISFWKFGTSTRLKKFPFVLP